MPHNMNTIINMTIKIVMANTEKHGQKFYVHSQYFVMQYIHETWNIISTRVGDKIISQQLKETFFSPPKTY